MVSRDVNPQKEQRRDAVSGRPWTFVAEADKARTRYGHENKKGREDVLERGRTGPYAEGDFSTTTLGGRPQLQSAKGRGGNSLSATIKSGRRTRKSLDQMFQRANRLDLSLLRQGEKNLKGKAGAPESLFRQVRGGSSWEPERLPRNVTEVVLHGKNGQIKPPRGGVLFA